MPSERSWVSDSLSIRQSLHQHQQGSMSTLGAQALTLGAQAEMTEIFTKMQSLDMSQSAAAMQQCCEENTSETKLPCGPAPYVARSQLQAA